jgi:hypothetical protein
MTITEAGAAEDEVDDSLNLAFPLIHHCHGIVLFADISGI